MECKSCRGLFTKKCNKGYVNFCSHKCYLKHHSKHNPGLYAEYLSRHIRWQKKAKKTGCYICGFDRAVDLCHIKWRKDGGKVNKQNITILCPNHHRLFDSGKLTEAERQKIKPIYGH